MLPNPISRIFLFAACACMAYGAETRPHAPREFFVACHGSDTNPGTAAKPFRSLEKARDAVRPLLPGMQGDIIVTIRGGEYPVRKAIHFGPEDSGRGMHRVIYRAAKGETPVFTGGVPVTGWKPWQKGIWKAPLHRQEKLRALYIGSARAFMANSGKKIRAQGGWGTFTITAGQAPWAWQSGQTADGILYNASDLPRITHNVSDVEIENQTTWNKNFVGVRDISMEGDKLVFKLQQPYGAIAQQIGWTAGLTLDSEQIIHNAFELLDEPGEFYFDRAEKTIYYIP
ncbi:MAG: right-handed parallel beta-helix repeat-containing protein, partial [Verrucomicrobia bacterium]